MSALITDLQDRLRVEEFLSRQIRTLQRDFVTAAHASSSNHFPAIAAYMHAHRVLLGEYPRDALLVAQLEGFDG